MHSPSDEHRSDSGHRRSAIVGIAGVALALSAMAGAPAIADSHGSHGSDDARGSQSKGHEAGHTTPSHSAQSSQAQTHGSTSQGSGGHGASETSSTTANDTSGHNPPGNNGTVFIHDVAGDNTPHNVPHVGCTFYVDFFGFDAGQTGTVTFAGQAPTGKDTALGGTWNGVMSTDDASGAGNDFDLELTFTADQLGVTSLGPPAHPGYHVKMTVATNEPGGKKSKVFWISPCTTPTVVGGTTGGAVLGSGVSVLGSGATRSGTTTVLGEKFTRRAGAASVAGTSIAGLPFTGAEIARMIAAGLALLTGGATLLAAARRRRYQPAHRS